MQTVPSLIGAGTAIAAAASGLVFGQPRTTDDASSPTNRRVLHKRSDSVDPAAAQNVGLIPSSSFSRPATGSSQPSMGPDLAPKTTPSPRSASHSRSRPPLSRYQRPQSSHAASSSNRNSRNFYNHNTAATTTAASTPSFSPETGASQTPNTQPNLDGGLLPASESRRNSISSSSSWLRRLSVIRPLSQHGSPRSSVIVENRQSATFSHGSAAPILRPNTAAPTLAPNKLVKRSSSTQKQDSVEVSRSRSKGHLPTLRRPATSHQRSATLQQLRLDAQEADAYTDPQDYQYPQDHHRRDYSFEQEQRPECLARDAPEDRVQRSRTEWLSFFHLHRAAATMVGGSAETSGRSPKSDTIRRISTTAPDKQKHRKVHLVKPRMVSSDVQAAQGRTDPAGGTLPRRDHGRGVTMVQPNTEVEQHTTWTAPSSDGVHGEYPTQKHEPQRPSSSRMKRSLSTSFASAAGHLASFSSGSLRRPKRRGLEAVASGDRRHVSAPITGASRALAGDDSRPRATNNPPMGMLKQVPQPLDSAAIAPPQPLQPSHKRNLSSPLPPLQRPSSFHADLSRAGFAGGAATHPVRLNQPSGSSTSSAAMSQLREAPHYERSPIMEGSESDGRGFISGDDDDTDFKSDTLYDSLRTVASSRARAVETPLESVYDESPPSTASNGKAKRLSIHEILDRTWDDDDKISEEDEASQTPVRAPRNSEAKIPPRSVHQSDFQPHRGTGRAYPVPPPSTQDFGRLSLEDDFDEDWARYDDDDIDAHISPLSAPSKSSLNSRGMNPNVKLALARIDSESADADADADADAEVDTETLPASERPLSSLFDWSEPSAQDKHEAERRSGRPQTAYGKQAVDSRGGRSAMRKGPAPAHVRSQSVPVVHEAVDEHKPTSSKYGTWGLGTKTVSEDWDEDFEFGSCGNDDRENDHMFAVPESIRASQPSVKAHSGQIREFSLLVNDLKRLCRHAKDMGILDGPQRALWKEAEGVIALASPDDDSQGADDDWDSSPSVDLDAFDGKGRHGDAHVEAMEEKREMPSSPSLEPTMSRTAVVRERQSPRRRSVFSPDDDIFGGSPGSIAESKAGTPLKRPSIRPQTPENRADVNGVVRSVMETMQHRSHSDSVIGTTNNRKVQFDTNSLKALVRRSGELRDALSDIIRRADQLTQSPARPLRHERGADSSPAFTRVFDDPGSSPPRRAIKSRGNASVTQTASPENSPPQQIGRRFPLMTVR